MNPKISLANHKINDSMIKEYIYLNLHSEISLIVFCTHINYT